VLSFQNGQQTTADPDDLRDLFISDPDEGGRFLCFPIAGRETAAGGEPDQIGPDWAFSLNMSAANFEKQFGGSPTARTFVAPNQVSAAACEIVNQAADDLLPAELAGLVRRTNDRYAVPILDIAPPGKMVWKVGDDGPARAVLLGNALAHCAQRPYKGPTVEYNRHMPW